MRRIFKPADRVRSGLARHRVQEKPAPVQILNWIAIGLSFVVLGGALLNSLLQAFSESPEAGIRSLAATLLPPIIITFITVFTRLFRPPATLPEFNLFFIFTVWTTILFIIVSFYSEQRFPIGEFALSFTLSWLAFIGQHSVRNAFISCCYGVLCGTLIYVLLFGLPF